MSDPTTLTEEERREAVEVAVNIGTYVLGAWGEGMAGARDTSDGWEHAAATEAVDLFAPQIARLLAARVSTATEDTAASGDDLRDRVTAVRDKWAAFVFYDVAAMQLRNSFRNDLDDALAVSPVSVVSRPEATDHECVTGPLCDGWPYGDDDAFRTIAAVANPGERQENRDGWAVTMRHRPDLFAQESKRARERLEAAIGHAARAVSLAAIPEAGDDRG